MAHCPKCGRKLHLYDWKPECPGCHVNLNYYQSNEKLLEDSEKAEIEHAKFQPKVDRAKAAYAGSKLAILRIVLSLLPIAGLFLPLCSFTGAERKSVNAIGLYNYISEIGFDKLLSGDKLSLSIIFLLLSVALILIGLICIIASLGRYGKLRSAIVYGVQLLSAIASAVLFTLSPVPAGYTASALGAGAFVYLALLLVLDIFVIILNKVGIPVHYKTCLIGGLPSETYYDYVSQGMSQSEIRRKMLVALAELQEQDEAAHAEEEKEAIACP